MRPSIYTEALSKGFGFGGTHHVGFWPDDMQAARRELTAQGFEEVASIRSPGGEVDVYYFRSPPGLDVMLEIVPMTLGAPESTSRRSRRCANNRRSTGTSCGSMTRTTFSVRSQSKRNSRTGQRLLVWVTDERTSWSPTDDRIDAANMTAFMRFVEGARRTPGA